MKILEKKDEAEDIVKIIKPNLKIDEEGGDGENDLDIENLETYGINELNSLKKEFEGFIKEAEVEADEDFATELKLNLKKIEDKIRKIIKSEAAKPVKEKKTKTGRPKKETKSGEEKKETKTTKNLDTGKKSIEDLRAEKAEYDNLIKEARKNKDLSEVNRLRKIRRKLRKTIKLFDIVD